MPIFVRDACAYILRPTPYSPFSRRFLLLPPLLPTRYTSSPTYVVMEFWCYSDQMSEIRKALEVMKRVDSIEDAPARRLALELGTLACDRGQSAARRAENSRDILAADGGDVGTLARRERAVYGSSDGRGVQITAASCEGRGRLGVEVGDRSHQLFLAPFEETGK